MKIAVIGGGSTYTPEIVMGFIKYANTLPITELWLMDIDEGRLKIVGEFCQRIAAANQAPFQIHLSIDQREALRGATYIITQFRVGQMLARREDEYLCKRHGLIGQETTGIGGMAKALRTIPVIMELAQKIRDVAPGAVLANFTNPSGLITQALSMYAPDIHTVGVCNVAMTTKMLMCETVEKLTGKSIDPDQCQLDTLGLNHLTFHRGFKCDGRDLWPVILEAYINDLKSTPEPEFPPQLIQTLQMIPNYYLQYFYSTKHKLLEQEKWPPSRADTVIEVEKVLLREYAERDRTCPPADLMKRGGTYYSTAAIKLLNSHYNNLGETHVVNVRHNGAVSGWPEDWVLEMPCTVDANGFHPQPAPPLPEVCFGLIAQIKSFEILTARAAVTGDRDILRQAILANPLGPDVELIDTLIDDLLITHKKHLQQFN